MSKGLFQGPYKVGFIVSDEVRTRSLFTALPSKCSNQSATLVCNTSCRPIAEWMIDVLSSLMHTWDWHRSKNGRLVEEPLKLLSTCTHLWSKGTTLIKSKNVGRYEHVRWKTHENYTPYIFFIFFMVTPMNILMLLRKWSTTTIVRVGYVI